MQVLDASIEIDAPAERVWDVVADTARYGEWNPFITAVAGEPREGAELKVTIRAPGRKPVTFAARVTRLVPGRELRWRGRWFLPGLFDGDHALTVEPLGERPRPLPQPGTGHRSRPPPARQGHAPVAGRVRRAVQGRQGARRIRGQPVRRTEV